MANYMAEPVVHRECYTIAAKPDLIVTVTQQDTTTSTCTGQLVQLVTAIRIYEFEVARGILAGVPYFRDRIPLPVPGKASLDVVALKDDDPRAVKIWLQILHGTYDSSSFTAPIITVWHMLVVAERYRLNPKDKDAQKWFKRWLANRFHDTYDECCQLLFPLHSFDDADGFAAVTMKLAYTGQGHIVEKRPQGFHDDHMRLGQNVIRE